MKQLSFTCYFLLLTTIITKAQTNYTWNGTTSSAFTIATNWTPNGVPAAADNVTIVTGANPCVLSASTSITNLTITSGTIDLGTYTLTTTGLLAANGGNCNNGGLNATGSSQIFGGTTFGVNISVVPASTNNVFFNGSIFNGSVTAINRYTTGGTVSTPSTALSGNQTITLYFDVNDQVYDGANLTIVKNTAAAPTAWIDIGGTGGPAALGGIALAGSVSSTSSPSAFNSFSTFTLGSKIGVWNPLPVEMLYFTAKPVDTDAKLAWATATETNNDHFEVERSNDGKTFEHVTNVNAYGTGNSTQTQTYQSTDNKPYSGISYYRLKQVDHNGAFKYSNIATVNFDKKSFVTVYPNPASNNIYINASSDYENATVKVIDALGREVLSQTMTSTDNSLINTTSLESGMYHIMITNGADVYQTKIIIQK